MVEASDRLVRVATGYGMAETAMAISFLKAHGLQVVALPHNMASISWDLMVALGGIEIRVPESQVSTALILLAEDPELPAAIPAPRSTSRWLRRLAAILIFVLFQVPPPAHGFYRSSAAPSERSLSRQSV